MINQYQNPNAKKAIIISFFLSLVFFAFARAQAAPNDVVPWNNGWFENPSSLNSVQTVVANITNWILSFTGAIVILFLIIGGIYYITAAGDDKQMEEGKKIINYAIIGLIVVLISYSLVKALDKIIFG